MNVWLDFSEHQANVHYFKNLKSISLLSKNLIYNTETHFDKVGKVISN